MIMVKAFLATQGVLLGCVFFVATVLTVLSTIEKVVEWFDDRRAR